MRYNLLVAPITVFVLFMFACSNSEDPEGPAPSVSSSSSEEQSILQVSSSSLLISSSSSSSSARSSSSQASSSSSVVGCTRAGLEATVDTYLAAIKDGDPTLMSLASNAKYIQNDTNSAFDQRLWKTKITVDFSRNLIDVQECATYTEIIAATQSYPYVIGTRLKVKDGEITEVYAIVTSKDWGWLFNAADYLKYSQREDWSPIPVDERLTREELRRAGFAYMEYFGDKSVDVPWGIPCARLEGGAYTGDYATSTCNVGVPDLNMNPVARATYLVDVDYGMSVLFFNFGGPDSHWFRVLNTGIRYIHTLTAMKNELPTPR